MEQTITCPICGQTNSSTVCPQCGFENRLMLASGPNTFIQQIDSNRIAIAKKNWDRTIKLQEQIESLTEANEKSNNQISELDLMISTLNTELEKLSRVEDETNRLRSDLVEKQQKIDVVIAERDALQDENRQLIENKNDLDNKTKELSEELSAALDDVKHLKSALDDALNRPVQDTIVGFLALGWFEESLTGEKGYRILEIFPIYQGKNVFGKMPKSAPDIHPHNILFECSELQKEHFSIDFSNNVFMARKIAGDWGVGNKFNNVSEESLSSKDEIFIGKMIFTFITLE